VWQKRIAAAQSRLKKLEKQMERRIPVAPPPSPPPAPPPPPPPPPQDVEYRPAWSACMADEETRRKVERIKALALAQPGASPLTIMGALE